LQETKGGKKGISVRVPGLRSMKLMIVDDDAVTRALLRQIFSQVQGVDIVEAQDGLDAWDQLEAGACADLCLLDVMMPRMDGFQLLRRLRQDDRFNRLKVIICSVARDGESIKAAVSLNVEGYILKPFTREAIRQVFNRATQHVPQTEDQLALGSLEPPRPKAQLLDESLAFLELADGELGKLRQWLKEDNRLAAWESVGALLNRARKLNLHRFVRAMESLESAVMAGNSAAALIALDAAELAMQSMLSLAIGKPVFWESNDGGVEAFTA
jgi:two-component system, chemotaxis family, chemotaxis protein CheY